MPHASGPMSDAAIGLGTAAKRAERRYVGRIAWLQGVPRQIPGSVMTVCRPGTLRGIGCDVASPGCWTDASSRLADVAWRADRRPG